MNPGLFTRLYEEGLISNASAARVDAYAKTKLFSIHWELRTLLYVGILLFTSGIGILVYKNIDTIGHQIVLAFIAGVTIASFYYCNRKKLPFSKEMVPAPSRYFDHILLLACTTLLIFLGYLQAQYEVFGTAYGLATFIPMLILFFSAYYFDHRGVLTMAITNLAAWAGIAVTPTGFFRDNKFNDDKLIFAGLLLGCFLCAISYLSEKISIKKHFSFTYLNFGMNIVFISCLAGMFYFDTFYFLWLLPLALISLYFYRIAIKKSSFYIALMTILYAYIGITYVILYTAGNVEFGMLYLMGSAAGVAVILYHLNRKLKNDAGIQN